MSSWSYEKNPHRVENPRAGTGLKAMLIVDDLLMAPVKGLFWVFREIANAVDEDLAAEPAAITARLGELYMMLETGQMTEAEFDAAEATLLDRLDELREEAEAKEKPSLAGRTTRSKNGS